MKHIGILAHSAEGAALCYRSICMGGIRRLGAHLHPEITMTGVAMRPVLEDYNRDLGRVREVFRHGAGKLAADGRRKNGVLGTNWTMTGPDYPEAFGRRGLIWEIPGEADRELIHRVIFMPPPAGASP